MDHSLSCMIRPMEPRDVPTVVAIERLSFPTPWLPSSFLYELNHNPRSFYYVLLEPSRDAPVSFGRRCSRWLRGVVGLADENRLIGYTGFRLLPAEAHISTIAVHPDWRGKGLGDLLLLTVMEQALELGVSSVTLEVRPSNRVAQQLYRKYGFRFKGVHRGYYRDGEDAWLMGVGVSQGAYRRRLAEMRQALAVRLDCCHPVDVGQNDGDTL